jgi:hypothetical protein
LFEELTATTIVLFRSVAWTVSSPWLNVAAESKSRHSTGSITLALGIVHLAVAGL